MAFHHQLQRVQVGTTVSERSREGFLKFSYHRKYAWGHDDLQPVSETFNDGWVRRVT